MKEKISSGTLVIAAALSQADCNILHAFDRTAASPESTNTLPSESAQKSQEIKKAIAEAYARGKYRAQALAAIKEAEKMLPAFVVEACTQKMKECSPDDMSEEHEAPELADPDDPAGWADPAIKEAITKINAQVKCEEIAVQCLNKAISRIPKKPTDQVINDLRLAYVVGRRKAMISKIEKAGNVLPLEIVSVCAKQLMGCIADKEAHPPSWKPSEIGQEVLAMQAIMACEKSANKCLDDAIAAQVSKKSTSMHEEDLYKQ